MNKEELYSKLVKWLENISELASSEIPSFIKEAATYGFFNSLIMILIFLTLTLITFYLSIVFYRNNRVNIKKLEDYIKTKEFYQLPPEEVLYKTSIFELRIAICIFLVGLFFLFVTISSINNCLKAAYAPRLYVIERFIK